MQKCVLTGKALLSYHGEGVANVIHAYQNATKSLGKTEDYFTESIDVKFSGIIPPSLYKDNNYSDFNLRKKIQISLEKIFDQLKPVLQGIETLDSLFLNVGTSEFRAVEDDNGVCLRQSEWLEEICNQLKKHSVFLKDPSRFFLIDNVCASTTVSMGIAAEKIRMGMYQNSLVLGMDLVTLPVLTNLQMLGALSQIDCEPEMASRPFSKTRAGFVRAEALGAVILESDHSAQKRGQKYSVELHGYGHSSDAEHITAGCENSLGIIAAMKRSLTSSKLNPSDIHLIKAHGTGTLINDANEARGICTLFKNTPVISLKGQFGHAAASSGLFEAIICEFLIRQKNVMPSMNSDDEDKKLNLNIIHKQLTMPHLKNIMMNSFGFGGNNCTLIMSEA